MTALNMEQMNAISGGSNEAASLFIKEMMEKYKIKGDMVALLSHMTQKERDHMMDIWFN